jgi:hypothetical protein
MMAGDDDEEGRKEGRKEKPSKLPARGLRLPLPSKKYSLYLEGGREGGKEERTA